MSPHAYLHDHIQRWRCGEEFGECRCIHADVAAACLYPESVCQVWNQQSMALTITPPSLCIFSVSLTLPPPPQSPTHPFFFGFFPPSVFLFPAYPPPPHPPFLCLPLSCSCVFSPLLPSCSFSLFSSPPPPPHTLLSLSSSLSLSLPSLSFFSLLCPVLGALIPWCCIAAYWCYHVLQRQQDTVGAVFPHGQARHSVCGGHRTQRPDAQHAGPVQHREKCKVNRHISTCSKQHLPFPPSFVVVVFCIKFFLGQS